MIICLHLYFGSKYGSFNGRDWFDFYILATKHNGNYLGSFAVTEFAASDRLLSTLCLTVSDGIRFNIYALSWLLSSSAGHCVEGCVKDLAPFS